MCESLFFWCILKACICVQIVSLKQIKICTICMFLCVQVYAYIYRELNYALVPNTSEWTGKDSWEDAGSFCYDIFW